MLKISKTKARYDRAEAISNEPMTLADAISESAKSVGLTENELLDRISDLAQETSLGGRTCLSPAEIAQYCRDHALLPFMRHEHLQECEDCRALVVASLPGAERRKQLVNELSRRRDEAAGSGRGRR